MADHLLVVAEIDQGTAVGTLHELAVARRDELPRVLYVLRITGLDARGFAFLMPA